MRFLSPLRLVLLALPAILAGAYALSRGRRQRTVVRFTALDLASAVAPVGAGWRRTVTGVAALAGAVTLVVAFARPVVAVPVPQGQATLVLAIDVSLSMGASDVAPTRLDAAQDAAARFLQLAADGLQIGLVAFADNALAVAAPQSDRAAVAGAIGRLALAPGTAVGEAIFASLEQLAVAADDEVPGAIVVLSDGETTSGRPESAAAEAATTAAVPVYAVAFGTSDGVVTHEGESIPVPVAHGSLQDVANATGGQFYETADEAGLEKILAAIGSEIGVATEDRELTDWFTMLGLLLVTAAVAGSIRWFGRLA